MRYLVVLSGGYERPDFYGSDDIELAKDIFDQWKTDFGEDDGWIHLLDVSGDEPVILEEV